VFKIWRTTKLANSKSLRVNTTVLLLHTIAILIIVIVQVFITIYFIRTFDALSEVIEATKLAKDFPEKL